LNLSRPWLNLMTILSQPSLTETIDHELGHAYSDWVGRGLTGCSWPDIDSTTALGRVTGLLIQCEGISKTFERGRPKYPFNLQWWPMDIDTTDLSPTMPGGITLAYSGGYQLVGSLVARYGMEKTVDYIVTHPLVINPKFVRWT